MTHLRVVITGASGFLGGHLVSSLESFSGLEVLALSRTGIRNTIKVSSYSDSPSGDILIHLAEDSNLENVAKHGLAYERSMLENIKTLFNKSYNRIVYISSAAVYGDRSKSPHVTTDETLMNSPYTRVKVLSEKVVLSHPKGRVIRLGNVYGSRMSSSNIISQILIQIPSSGDLWVGNSKPVRDFIWVKDVVEGIKSLALSDLSNFGTKHIYNLGSGIGTSIGDLARLALDIAGQPERRVVSRIQSTDDSSIVLNYAATTQACGWIPTTSLSDGLKVLLRSEFGFRK